MRGGDEVGRVDLDRLGPVLDAVRELGAITDLPQTLEVAVRRICEIGGFGSAAINVTLGSGDVRVEVVWGGATELLGQATPLATWLDVLDHANRWRDLRYYRHDQDQSHLASITTWEPPAHAHPLAPEDDPWHPGDLLLAPMWAPDGSLIGVVSVDEPLHGRFPDHEQLTVLELLAAQVGRAIAEAARKARSDDRATLFTSAFDGAAGAMAVVDAQLRLVALNRAARALTTRELRAGDPIADHVHPDDADEVAAACRAALASLGGRASVECRLPPGGGSTRWIRARAARVESTIAAPRLVVNLEDVTESRRVLAELRHQVGHDVLTGLPNRRLAVDLLQSQLEEDRRRADRVVAVLAFDLDGFKAVNDRCGHAAGDELLQQVARRLEGCLRPDDVLARLGGDEFLVLADVARADATAASHLAERCVVALRPAFELLATTCRVTLSAGVARSDDLDPSVEPDAAVLLELADRALYRAKGEGRDRWAVSST